MPSGKKSRELRRTQGKTPPPVKSKGGSGTDWMGGRRFWFSSGGVVIVIALIGLVIALASGGSSKKPIYVDFSAITGLQNGPPPWNNDVGSLQANLSAVHLDPLAQEALAFHIHQHLDIYVNGKHVAVPALIGIDGNSFITEMHTHDSTGVVHVESGQNRPYTLGQFFGEWGVRLTAGCLGRYCANVRWWLDGVRQTGNPAHLVLKEHQEIVIAAGTPPAHIPSSYKWSPGL